MKHIHRLIVTSNTYRLSSSSAGAADETLAADPENRFYWRMNPIRMEAQVVRDSLLHLAGELDLTLGGPSIPVDDEASRRRSLYFVHSHNEHQKFLSMFDDASVLECYRRAESIVPQQALALENSQLATAMAEKIAERIAAAEPERVRPRVRPRGVRDGPVRRAVRSRTGRCAARRSPDSTEAAAKQQAVPDPQRRARTDLIHALLNHNDFVTIR